MPNRGDDTASTRPSSSRVGTRPAADPVHGRLDRLREEFRGPLPANVASIVHAAEVVAEQWQRHQTRRIACWSAYEESLAIEAQTLQLLLAVLDAVDAVGAAGGFVMADDSMAGVEPALEAIPPPYTDLRRALSDPPPPSDLPPAEPTPHRRGRDGLLRPVTARALRHDRKRDAAQLVGPNPATAPTERRPLEAYLLGPFRLVRSGQLVDGWQGVKAPRVARYLFAHRGRPVAREVLMELFWPELDPETARRGLHQAIYQIRRTLRSAGESAERIVYRGDAYVLDTDHDWWCDIEEFERHAEAGRRAEQRGERESALAEYRSAMFLYGGNLLEDTPFEEWSIHERDRLRLLYLDLANRLADLLLDKGDVGAALETTQRVLQCEPCDEVAHRRAMRCYSVAGQRTAVIRQYNMCAEALNRAFELEPDAETTKLYQASIRD